MANYYNDGIPFTRLSYTNPKRTREAIKAIEFANACDDLKRFKKDFPKREDFIEHFMATGKVTRQQAEHLWDMAKEGNK